MMAYYRPTVSRIPPPKEGTSLFFPRDEEEEEEEELLPLSPWSLEEEEEKEEEEEAITPGRIMGSYGAAKGKKGRRAKKTGDGRKKKQT